ncbi:hypothetical protein FDP41_006883 [Naegleria fowleri]|uniref:Uncharacterized protein n=2 Tax=Naegleria fowleri TaxID=5763 RepID=A0A6A5B713_NAEFO|nr:uncharacterized protein FDP41_006883 [Naegleria fowleri]KAF0974273.1 hypothetical protein FDP41_006883 [Naegleria fowleri]
MNYRNKTTTCCGHSEWGFLSLLLGSSNMEPFNLMATTTTTTNTSHLPFIKQVGFSNNNNGFQKTPLSVICLECALKFMFDSSQLSLRRVKALQMVRMSLEGRNWNQQMPKIASSCATLVKENRSMIGNSQQNSVPSFNMLSSTNSQIENEEPQHASSLCSNTISSILLSCILGMLDRTRNEKNVLATTHALQRDSSEPSHQRKNVDQELLSEIIDLFFQQVSHDFLLNHLTHMTQMLIDQNKSEQVLESDWLRFVCGLFTALQESHARINEQFEGYLNSMLKLCVSYFTDGGMDTSVLAQYTLEKKITALFIMIKYLQLDTENLSLDSFESHDFVTSLLNCLLKQNSEDLHMNALAVLYGLIERFCLHYNSKEKYQFISILLNDANTLIDALISVILSPNIGIQLLASKIIQLLCSPRGNEKLSQGHFTTSFMNSDIWDFILECLRKSESAVLSEILFSILCSFVEYQSLTLVGDMTSKDFTQKIILMGIDIFTTYFSPACNLMNAMDEHSLSIMQSILKITKICFLSSESLAIHQELEENSSPQLFSKIIVQCTFCANFMLSILDNQQHQIEYIPELMTINLLNTLNDFLKYFIDDSFPQQRRVDMHSFFNKMLDIFKILLTQAEFDSTFEEFLLQFLSVCLVGYENGNLLPFAEKIDAILLSCFKLSMFISLHSRMSSVYTSCLSFFVLRLRKEHNTALAKQLMERKVFSLLFQSSSADRDLIQTFKILSLHVLHTLYFIDMNHYSDSVIRDICLDFENLRNIMSCRTNTFATLEFLLALLHASFFNEEHPIGHEQAHSLLTLFAETAASCVEISPLCKLKFSELFAFLCSEFGLRSSHSHAQLVVKWYLQVASTSLPIELTNLACIVKWISRHHESTLPGVTLTFISNVVLLRTEDARNGQSSISGISLLREAGLDVFQSLMQMVSTDKQFNSLSHSMRYICLFHEYFINELHINEREITSLLQQVVEPILCTCYISLKKGSYVNSEICQLCDEISTFLPTLLTRTDLAVPFSSSLTTQLNSLFQLELKLFQIVTFGGDELWPCCISVGNIISFLMFLLAREKNTILIKPIPLHMTNSHSKVISCVEHIIERLEPFLSKTTTTMVTLSSSSTMSYTKIMSFILQLQTSIFIMMKSASNVSVNILLHVKFIETYGLSHESPLIRVMASTALCTICSKLEYDEKCQVWKYSLVHTLLNNILNQNEEIIAFNSVYTLYMLECSRPKSKSVLSQVMWNEFIVRTIIADQLKAATFDGNSQHTGRYNSSFILYLYYLHTKSPTPHQFFSMLHPFLNNENFLQQLLNSVETPCISEWLSLIQIFIGTFSPLKNDIKSLVRSQFGRILSELEDYENVEAMKMLSYTLPSSYPYFSTYSPQQQQERLTLPQRNTALPFLSIFTTELFVIGDLISSPISKCSLSLTNTTENIVKMCKDAKFMIHQQ